MTDIANGHHKGHNFYITGAFDRSLVETVIAPMDEWITKAKREQVPARMNLHLNSSGGYCKIAFHIIRLIEEAKRVGITVQTAVVLDAYSCASMVAVAGSRGHRLISREAEHLVHYGQFDGWGKTTPLQLERHHDFSKRHVENLAKHYERHCSIPELRERLKDDLFLIPADKAIDWGLADHYWGGDEE